MANRKINELSPRTPSLTDLIIVGDPSTGYSFKATISVLAAFAGSNIQFSSLGGISLTSPTSGQYLTFNGTNWVNSTLSTTTWDTAYNRSLTAAAVTGTTNKTLTLTKQDGSTLTASWSDLNTDAVTSVFGRTGVVVAAEGDYSLTQLSDVTITTASTNQVLQYNGTDWVNATFVAGINSLNGLTATTQTFATGTSGTDFAISSSTSTHTFNLPTASGTNRGALSSADWTTFNGKVGGSGTTNYLPKWTGSSALGNSLVFDNGTQLGIGTTTPTTGYELDLVGDQRISGNLLLGSSGSGVRIQNSTTNFGTITIGSDGYSGSGMSIAPYYGGSIGWITGPSASYEINFNTHLGVRGKDFSQYNSSGTIAFYIKNSNGNVIIGNGTTDAGFKLDVTGTFRSTLDANINGLTVGKGGGQLNFNTAFGVGVLNTTNTGSGGNTAFGYFAIRSVSSGEYNVGVGAGAGQSISTGSYNILVGRVSGKNITTGSNNVIIGDGAAEYGSSSIANNTILGTSAGQGSLTSSNNVLIGMGSGANLSSGAFNTFLGKENFPGNGITTGSFNTIIGSQVTGLSSSLSNTIILADGQGNQRLYINSSGNVGIGTTSPTAILETYRSTDITGRTNTFTQNIFSPTSGFTGYFKVNVGARSTRGVQLIFGESGNSRPEASITYDVVDFDIVGGSGNIKISTTTNERMRIFGSTGNVFIGSSPTDAGYKLDVNGTARVSGTTYLATSSGQVSIGTTSPIAGWTLYNSGNFRQEGNMYVVGTLQAGNISQPGSAMTINIISSLGRNITFTDGSGSTNGDYVRFFSTNTIGNITSGSANLLLVNPTINQTSGAGTIIGYRFNPTNTALVSSVYSFYADSGTAYFGANVGIGTSSPNASALLDITSTTKGFLPPRMTGAQAEAIATPAAGLMVYANNGNGTTITSLGWWGYDGTNWVKLN